MQGFIDVFRKLPSLDLPDMIPPPKLRPNMWRWGFPATNTSSKENETHCFENFTAPQSATGQRWLNMYELAPKIESYTAGGGGILLLRYRVKSDKFIAADLNGR
jgi:hypothetical protein